jgi:signal peptidase I
MKVWFKDNRSFILFMCCFGFFRLAVADWNPIPSGSMRPTLLEGDVVLVNRLAYDFKLPLTDVVVAKLGQPQRGDVVTFVSPKDGVRLIKRLVALPGDVVEMHNEVLFINGVAGEYLAAVAVSEPLEGEQTPAIQARERVAGHERAVQVLPELNAMRSFGPVQVPAGQSSFWAITATTVPIHVSSAWCHATC